MQCWAECIYKGSMLLCNVLHSIIESHFVMVLITGHNMGEARKPIDLYNLHSRRLRLESLVGTFFDIGEQWIEIVLPRGLFA